MDYQVDKERENTSDTIENFNNTIHFDEKSKNSNIELDETNVNSLFKKDVLDMPKLRVQNMLTVASKQFNIDQEELGYYKMPYSVESSIWDSGGTWSSEQAGVRFNMNARNTLGVDKSMVVTVLDWGIGVKSKFNGFMNKNWMAKANAHYGNNGPVTIFAMNLREKSIAVFVGFVHSQNNKYFVTGMWSVGRNCRNYLDIHQSVCNIPDVLYRDCI